MDVPVDPEPGGHADRGRHACSAPTAARLLKAEGYSLQATPRSPRQAAPGPDAQFRYIAAGARAPTPASRSSRWSQEEEKSATRKAARCAQATRAGSGRRRIRRDARRGGDAPKAVRVHRNAYTTHSPGRLLFRRLTVRRLNTDPGGYFVRTSDHGCCRLDILPSLQLTSGSPPGLRTSASHIFVPVMTQSGVSVTFLERSRRSLRV